MFHSNDYSQLVGELHYSPRSNTWRLRYAAIGDEDPYGGVVVLQGLTKEVAQIPPGSIVAVRGKISDAAGKVLTPDFQVMELQIVGQ